VLAEPDSAHHDRDGEEEGEKIEESDNVVAEANHGEESVWGIMIVV